RPARVGDGRQRVVVDLHRLERVLGQVAALGDDERDWLADVADLVARERRLQAGDDTRAGAKPHGDAADVAQVLGRDDGADAGTAERHLRADRVKARVRVRRSEDG